MIQSFANSAAHKVWERKHVRELGPDVQRSAYRKLLILNRAENLNDLRVPPGNRLEKLVGNRTGLHSIRVNDQFRICFVWTPNGPADVEIVDYH
ncbi:type II toxin-antitoxin system RelE/ParE family toxin [Nocardioides hungaricus]